MPAKTVTGAKKAAVEKAPSQKPARKSSAEAKAAHYTGKYYYFFGDGKADGRADMKELLGGKGANLAEMTNAGVPVPPGFTITTEVCRIFYQNNMRVPKDIDHELEELVGQD